jgi:hypothetical protein
VIRAMQQEPDRRYSNTAEMMSEVENIRQTPMPNAATAAGGKKVAASPAAAKSADGSAASAPRRETHITPWLAGIAAVCALVAVSVVIIQMRQPPREVVGQIVPPPAPELTPLKSKAPPPVADEPIEKSEPTIAKAEPVAPVATVQPKAGEPPVPVAPPPSEPPVAVASLPGPSRVEQIVPSPVATSSLEPAPRATLPVQPQPPAPGTPIAEPADSAADWHSFVSRGDALMQQHQRDDALDSYLNAFDLATDGRSVAAADVAQLCKKLANFQMSFGSLAEARQTLEHGRQALKKMAAGKDGVERQKYLEQIENTLRTLPRD